MDDTALASSYGLPHQTVVGDFLLDRQTIRVWRKDKPLKLSMRQFRLMDVFIQRPGQPISRQILKDLVWGSEATVSLASVDAEIVHLRRAIGGRMASSPIRTVRGLGYVFILPRLRRNSRKTSVDHATVA